MRNNFFVFSLIFISLTFFITINYYFNNKEFMSSYVSELETLEQTIIENEQLIKDLESDITYNSSKEFIEKTAREKLGFVMPDEIVFIEN